VTERVISLGFTGTRRGMSALQLAAVAERLCVPGLEQVHSGDCIGADAQFHALAIVVPGKPVIHGHPPEDPRYRAFLTYNVENPPRPYLVRDRDIVAASTHVVACPGEFVEVRRGSGTWATIRYAIAAGRPLDIIFPDGAVRTVRPEEATTP
jgi:hypothetical protein